MFAESCVDSGSDHFHASVLLALLDLLIKKKRSATEAQSHGERHNQKYNPVQLRYHDCALCLRVSVAQVLNLPGLYLFRRSLDGFTNSHIGGAAAKIYPSTLQRSHPLV